MKNKYTAGQSKFITSLTFLIRPWCSPHENSRVLNGLVIIFGASTINENTAYSHQMYSYIPHIHKLIYLVGIAAIYMLQSDRFYLS